MKKYLITLLILITFVLSACGENTENNHPENEMEESKQVEEQGDSKSEEDTSTDDVIEFVTNDKYDTYTRYLDEYKDIGTYVNDKTNDEGFNEIDFDGFHVKFVFKLLEDKNNGEQIIGFIAETVNNTDDPVYFNADMKILTSEQEQTEAKRGLGTSDPGGSVKGLLEVPLNDGTPDSFEVTLDPPFRGIDNDGNEEGHLGDPIEMKFHKE